MTTGPPLPRLNVVLYCDATGDTRKGRVLEPEDFTMIRGKQGPLPRTTRVQKRVKEIGGTDRVSRDDLTGV